MKRLLVFIFCFVTTLNVAADEVDKIRELFNKGDYGAVKNRVEYLHEISPIEYDDEFVKLWTDKCDKAIKEQKKKEQEEAEALARKKAKQDSINAVVDISKNNMKIQELITQQAIAEAEKKKAQAKIMDAEAKEREREAQERLQKEEERKQNKLVYISVETDIPGLEKEICSFLSAGEEKVLTTSVIDDALWKLTVKTSIEEMEKQENDYYRLVFRAEIEILNLLTNEYLFKKVLTTEERKKNIKIAKYRADKSLVDSIKSFIIDDNICKKITQY